MISKEKLGETEDLEIQRRGQVGWSRGSDGESVEMGSEMSGREYSGYRVSPGKSGKDK